MNAHDMGNFYMGWGWILWVGFIFLMVSSFGNWGYTYQAHRKYGGQTSGTALDILNERYARGEIKRDEYVQLKSDIASAS